MLAHTLASPTRSLGWKKSLAPGKLGEIMQNLEMRMYCKDYLNSIIKEGEGNDSNEIAKCMVNEAINLTFKSPLPKSTQAKEKKHCGKTSIPNYKQELERAFCY